MLIRPCRPEKVEGLYGTAGFSARTQGCGHNSLAGLPNEGGKGQAIVCAVCDRALDYPKIREAS